WSNAARRPSSGALASMRPDRTCPRAPEPGRPMYLYVKALTFDCVDALALARFWASVLGSDVDEESTSEKAFVEAPGWGGPNMWFNRVPEPKTAKNRLHLDLRTLTSMDEEVARLE